MNRRTALGTLLMIVVLCPIASSQPSSREEEQVWKLEEAFDFEVLYTPACRKPATR